MPLFAFQQPVHKCCFLQSEKVVLLNVKIVQLFAKRDQEGTAQKDERVNRHTVLMRQVEFASSVLIIINIRNVL